MRLTSAFVAILTYAVLSMACGEASNADSASRESNLTSAGDGGTERTEQSVDTAASVVAPYTDTNQSVQLPTQLRFGIGGEPSTDAVQVTWTLAGGDRRFQIQGLTPAKGGVPMLYAEFGRGKAPIESGVYDCAADEAVIVLVEATGKLMTAVAGGPQRACRVIIEQAILEPYSTQDHSFRRVLGRIEAEVGPRDDAQGATKSIRAAFATMVNESSVP